MEIQLHPASLEEKPILQRLMQLYFYDFSELLGDDLNACGEFEYAYTDLYWVEATRFPFLFRVQGNLAGFALVCKATHFPETVSPEHSTSLAEFFILRKYRRLGLGEQAARLLFDQFPGRWEVAQIPENEAATQFWRKVIHRYTGGNFQEVLSDSTHWQGPVHIFEPTHPPLIPKA